MRRFHVLPAALAFVLSCVSAVTVRGQNAARTWTFDTDVAGEAPGGFEAAAGEWRIVRDSAAPSGRHALAQLAENTRPTFNVILATGTSYGDVDVSVKMKPIAGEIDQGGGIVWRARDHRNYYIARFNPLEDNYRVYKVVDGRREQLESADLEPEPGWHTLRVTMRGGHIQCYLDGKKHLEAMDETFGEAGRIGLWTKADAQTRFDDLTVSALADSALDPGVIERASGARASRAPDGVVRIGWPRTDVPVRVDGMPFEPFAGLGSWAAFKETPHGAMLMGDTVVFQDEVSAAMDAAFASGLEVSALHNHFFFDEPKVYFMHIGGHGEPATLARGVRAVWDAIKGVRAESPQPAGGFPGGIPTPGSLDTEEIERILGHEGAVQDGVLKVSIGRPGEMHGTQIGASMGLTTWVAFSGSDELAAIDGDFIMTAGEVQTVLRALRVAGIHVVALHNHMIGETPTFYFTHFWGKGPAKELARGFRAVLAAQATVGG